MTVFCPPGQAGLRALRSVRPYRAPAGFSRARPRNRNTIDVLKLTDEVKRINKTVDQLKAAVNDVDKPAVRLETIVEMAGYYGPKKIENHQE